MTTVHEAITRTGMEIDANVPSKSQIVNMMLAPTVKAATIKQLKASQNTFLSPLVMMPPQ